MDWRTARGVVKLTELELARLGDRKWLRSDFVKALRARLKAAGFKYCPSCAQVVPLDDFGHGGRCRSCDAEKGRKYYAANRAAVAERVALYRQVTRDAIDAIDDDAPEPVSDLLDDDFDDHEMNN